MGDVVGNVWVDFCRPLHSEGITEIQQCMVHVHRCINASTSDSGLRSKHYFLEMQVSGRRTASLKVSSGWCNCIMIRGEKYRNRQ